jgi:hypothetical protein
LKNIQRRGETMTHKKWVVNTFCSLLLKKAKIILTLKINSIKSWDRKENRIFDTFSALLKLSGKTL